MDARQQMVQLLTDHLQREFPKAWIASLPEPLTGSELITIRDGGVNRTVEVTERWFDGDEDVMPLAAAVEEWGLADAVRKLPAGATLRFATTGLVAVS